MKLNYPNESDRDSLYSRCVFSRRIWVHFVKFHLNV